MKLREYGAADRAVCLALFDGNTPEFFHAAERQDFAQFLDDLPGPYFVLESDSGDVIACGGYALPAGGSSAGLCWGMVARALHRGGVGRLLLVARLDHLCRATEGDLVVVLETSQWSEGFFARLGFSATQRVPDGFGPGLDRVRMEAVLNAATRAAIRGTDESSHVWAEGRRLVRLE
jgi:hypothetical protein